MCVLTFINIGRESVDNLTNRSCIKVCALTFINIGRESVDNPTNRSCIKELHW